jgi:nitroreductase
MMAPLIFSHLKMAKDIIKALNWRYATKTFDKDKKLSDEQFDGLMEAARLAPSSFGLEPWRFIVVKSPDLRAKFRRVAWDQPQITDASHLVVIAGAKAVDDAFVDAFVARTAKSRGVPVEALKAYGENMKGSLKGRTSEDIKAWAARQAYIPLGIMLESAALQGIDACPMEGFDHAKADELLGLDALGVQSLAVIALGYRANEEEAKKYSKVRLPKSEVVVEM